MKALQIILASTALSVVLAAGFAAPAQAQQTAPDAAATPTPTPAPAESAPAPAPAPQSEPAQPEPTPSTAPASDGVDFGDDSSQWAKDGECDDPRFAGTGSATELLEADSGHDATDCRAAYEAGTIAAAPDTAADAAEAAATGATPGTPGTPEGALPDFGDDTSEWAKDGECDDPRFGGPGSATELLEADSGHDATDCRTAYEAGTVTLGGNATAMATASNGAARIDFGDDSGHWAFDGECDDPDFAGPGMTAKPSSDSRLHDASDCRAAFEQGDIALGSATMTSTAAFDYGSDSSAYANDGECDDPRFEGPGTDKKLLGEDMSADASDCRSLEAQGQVSVRLIYTPGYAAGAPYDSSGLEFGDDSSDYANDGECDDPRLVGPGTASTLLESDREHDATDCRAAYEAGTVTFR